MRTGLAIVLAVTTLRCAVGCSKDLPLVVPQEEMEKVFEEVKTPFKRGLVIPGHDGLAVDSPSVFRKDGKWYMVYIIYDGRGYETWLAESEEPLEWKTLGRIMSYSEDTDWDVNQKAGYLALVDPKWGGSYELEKYEGKYWMSYLGGGTSGYESGVLSAGMAYTTGEPLIKPSEPFDNRYAHKPCMVKWKDTVYHFYCAVDQDDNRGIALATSKEL